MPEIVDPKVGRPLDVVCAPKAVDVVGAPKAVDVDGAPNPPAKAVVDVAKPVENGVEAAIEVPPNALPPPIPNAGGAVVPKPVDPGRLVVPPKPKAGGCEAVDAGAPNPNAEGAADVTALPPNPKAWVVVAVLVVPRFPNSEPPVEAGAPKFPNEGAGADEIGAPKPKDVDADVAGVPNPNVGAEEVVVVDPKPPKAGVELAAVDVAPNPKFCAGVDVAVPPKPKAGGFVAPKPVAGAAETPPKLKPVEGAAEVVAANPPKPDGFVPVFEPKVKLITGTSKKNSM